MRQVVPCKSAFTAPNLCWACALASPVTFLTGGQVMQVGFGQISPLAILPLALSTRDLGTELKGTWALGTRLEPVGFRG